MNDISNGRTRTDHRCDHPSATPPALDPRDPDVSADAGGTDEADQTRHVAIGDVQPGSGHLRDEPVDGNHIARLAEVLDACPPIVVQAATLRLVDGRHRLEAARLLGRHNIAAHLVNMPDEHLFAARVEANATHGLPLTRAERQRAVVALLEQHPDWSDRRIAQVVGVAHTTVGRTRARCPGGATDHVDAPSRLGRDGQRHVLCRDDARDRALAVLRRDPQCSARSIAREVGLSPTTVCDLRRHAVDGQADAAETGVVAAVVSWLRRLVDLFRTGGRR